MTCDYYDVALRVPWPGGRTRTLDARGAVGGDAAFATAKLATGRENVSLDATRALAAAERGVPGTFLLRGNGGGERFASRDHQDEVKRPRLALTLRDGRHVVLAPAADTTIDCTTNQALGMQQGLRVGTGYSAILRFAVPPAADVASATLALTGVQGFGAGTVALFALPSPVAPAVPAPRGLAATVDDERELAHHPDVLFTEDFESTEWSSRWSRLDFRNRAQRTDDHERHGFVPLAGHALRVTLAAGANLALDLRRSLGERRDSQPEEAYFRYYLRFGDDWGSDVDGGKLPGFAGTYGRAGWGGRAPDGTNGWNMRMTFAQRPPVGHPGRNLTAVGSEASLPPQRTPAPAKNGEPRWPWTNGFVGILEKNRWYCIEQHVRLNSPGAADGLFEAWVDGELALARDHVDFRYTPALRIEEIWLNVYHGGTAPAATEQHLYIDNVIVARRYIGPLHRSRVEASP